jgi:hypothetical protein
LIYNARDSETKEHLSSRLTDCGTGSDSGGLRDVGEKRALFFGKGMVGQGNGRRSTPQRLERRRDFPEEVSKFVRRLVKDFRGRDRVISRPVGSGGGVAWIKIAIGLPTV